MKDCDDLYAPLLAAGRASAVGLAGYLIKELPALCLTEYLAMRPSGANIVVFRHGTFDYHYDHYDALKPPHLQHPLAEARLVVAMGRSAPNNAHRDDYRLRGWVGPTGRTFGASWDKGHFIAHSIGGAVDGLEANVFLQNRSLNRGWSTSGRRFRAMERSCVANPGAFCFSRPIYADDTALPKLIEFGLLTPDHGLWVERFAND